MPTSASGARGASRAAPAVSPASAASDSSRVRALIWNGRTLRVLEQRDLPHRTRYINCRNSLQVADCIRNMSVRGAPAIGCAAAYGIVLAARERAFKDASAWKERLEHANQTLASTRPTAVNLFWALKRMQDAWTDALRRDPSGRGLAEALEEEAMRLEDEDLASCRRIGEAGSELLPHEAVVLTHCNTGALATAGHGTALGIVRSAYAAGRLRHVLVDETRPYLQGARLTAWELETEGIPYELITDNMAGHFMKMGEVSAVVVGADRVAVNGDTANKIGTYSLAVLARYHGLPFYVAAPTSTIDLSAPDGRSIPIEERSTHEVVQIQGVPIAPKRARARHPAFDVTPGELVTAIVTERGVAAPPYRSSLPRLLRDGQKR